MKSAYDKYYVKEEYFGNPYGELIRFFAEYEPKGHVLDLGCGQGRDSIMLGRIGYKVTGVDVSSVGIDQMMDKAVAENLNINGVVADYHDFSISGDHDIILLDSILHFYKRDIKRETVLTEKILAKMKKGAVFCNCMISGKRRERLFKSIISGSLSGYEVLLETYAEYNEYNSLYHIYIIKKTA